MTPSSTSRAIIIWAILANLQEVNGKVSLGPHGSSIANFYPFVYVYHNCIVSRLTDLTWALPTFFQFDSLLHDGLKSIVAPKNGL